MAENAIALKHYQMYIDGEFTESSSGEVQTITNPSDEQPISTVPVGTIEDVNRAVDAAYEAQKQWAKIPAPNRGVYLNKIATKIREKQTLLIETLMAEQGKVFDLAQTEILFAADYFDYMASAGRTYEGDIVQSDNAGEHIFIAKQPIGVAAGITAWNFPFFLIARKMGPALVTGNTIVIKPSSDTPNVALEFAKIIDEVGLPKGVANIVTGPGSVLGNELSINPKIGIISLTGSVNSGKRVMAAASNHVAKVSLELGGKAPAIVCDDADVDLAVQSIIDSRIDNNGQVCNNAERVYVQEGVAEEFIQKITAKMAAVKVGDPNKDRSINMGPLINQGAVNKVDGLVQRAVAAGGKIQTGGHPTKSDEGYYYEPTVITDVKQDSEIVQNEIFGPVLPVLTFKTLQEAIDMANDTRYGLTSSIYTNSLERATYAANNIHAGETYINRYNFEGIQGFHAGWKESGVGGADGKHGIEEFLNTHAVYLQTHEENL